MPYDLLSLALTFFASFAFGEPLSAFLPHGNGPAVYCRGIPRPLPLRAAEPHVFLVYLEMDGCGGCEGPPGGFRHGRVPDGPADRRFRYPAHRRAVLAGERIRHEGGLLDGDPLQLRRDLGPWGYPQQRVQRPYVSLPECVVIASPPVRHRADGGHYRSLRDLHG